MTEYELVVGLEIHVELKTKSGMFCGCKNDQSLDKKPNIYTCPVCLGLPGALPVPNKKAIDWTIMLGLALGSEINEVSKFDRKHYFYPDLPKGYQISQYDMPLCVGGSVDTSFGTVRLQRIHLEEDTGTLKHTMIDGKRVSLVDFNRSGTPLVEIVTEPDIHTGEHAKEFLKKLHQIVRYLGISDADMEKGSMRLEPNISVRKKGSTELPIYKVEVKNINSFKFVAAAIEYEFKRHVALLEKGETPAQETRGWNEDKNVTVSQRKKEGASDYRYFPDPDIPPLRFTKEAIQKIRESIPELPDVKKERFKVEYALSDYDASLLTDTRSLASYYEKALRAKEPSLTPKDIANWLINKKQDITKVSVVDFVNQVRAAKIVEAVAPEDLQKIVNAVCDENPKAIADYKSGKESVLMFLMGKVKAQLPKADVTKILEVLKRTLETN